MFPHSGNLRFQFEFRKIWIRKTPNMDNAAFKSFYIVAGEPRQKMMDATSKEILNKLRYRQL